jgi:N-acetylmuramoyl-L-alanine amidase
MIHRPSPNHGPRPAAAVIDMLVLHYTGMPSAGQALRRLCDPTAQVSAHYVIDEDGTVIALVPEERRAWHAGRACWRGRSDVNSASIGIELVNPGHEFGYRPFPPAQMAALADLAAAILARHPIPPRHVLAHADVAPLRKEDPGELFDWPGLARLGIGLWPFPSCGHPAAAAEPGRLREKLTAWGYDPAAELAAVVRAFHRHFRPADLDRPADGETLHRLDALLAAVAGTP